VDKQHSLLWPSAGCISPETEYFAVAIQDRVSKTRNYENHCLGVEVIDRCRKCDKMGVTIEHVIAGCSSLSDMYISGDTTNWQT